MTPAEDRPSTDATLGLSNARLLVVDDQEMNVVLLDRVLRQAGYQQVRTTTDPTAVAGIIDEWDPDLLLIDWRMHPISGESLLREVRRERREEELPVIVVTGEPRDVRRHALELGANDLVAKPFDALDLLLRIRHALRITVLHRRLRSQNQQLEQRVRERTEDLEVANRELLALDRLRRDFISMASHELRTPLTVIAGLTELWTTHEELLDSSQRRLHLDAMVRNVARMQELVENLLTGAQVEAGELRVRIQPTDLCQLVRRSVADAPESDAVTVECALCQPVAADPVLTGRVMSNLLVNAVRYGAPPVRVRVVRAGPLARVTVVDHGAGVPADFVPRLFERFSQASTGDRRTASGTGLGLWISRRMVELQGGELWYERHEAGGASFGFALPIHDEGT